MKSTWRTKISCFSPLAGAGCYKYEKYMEDKDKLFQSPRGGGLLLDVDRDALVYLVVSVPSRGRVVTYNDRLCIS